MGPTNFTVLTNDVINECAPKEKKLDVDYTNSQ